MGVEKVTTQAGANATLPANINIAGDNVLVGPDTLFVQMVKLDKGGDGISSPVSDANPWPVAIMNQGSSLIDPIPNSAIKLTLALNIAVPLPPATLPAAANGAVIYLQEGDLEQIIYRYDDTDPDANIFNTFKSDSGGAYFSINSRAKLLGLRLMLRDDAGNNGANLTITYFT